jgi:hypothetical protein
MQNFCENDVLVRSCEALLRIYLLTSSMTDIIIKLLHPVAELDLLHFVYLKIRHKFSVS